MKKNVRLYFGFNGEITRTEFYCGLLSILFFMSIMPWFFSWLILQFCQLFPIYTIHIRLSFWAFASLLNYGLLIMLLHLTILRARHCRHSIIIPIVLFLPWLTFLGLCLHLSYVPVLLLYIYLLIVIICESGLLFSFGLLFFALLSIVYFGLLLIKKGNKI